MTKKILMVLTSHDQLGTTGDKTGFWLEEMAAPYYAFLDAGAEVTLASPKGGQPPLDPKSDAEDSQTDATRRFADDPAAQKALANTHRLTDVTAADYDAVFYPGGHGPLWDLVSDARSIELIEGFWRARKPVAAVCHGPVVFAHAKTDEGEPLVAGRAVTAFSNDEEDAVGLTEVVPILVEDMLVDRGGKYRKAAMWAEHALADGQLITGQNPASSVATAKPVLEALSA